jgi:hypothetical protein
MKLEDIKATIDSYFDNISEQDLLELLSSKYHMPIVYDIDMSSITADGNTDFIRGIDSIAYELLFLDDTLSGKDINASYTEISCEVTSDDARSSLDLLSYAA